MARVNERGSIVEFVIVGGIMALLLVGGAYFVRHTLMPADQSTGSTAAQDDDESASSDETADNTAGEQSTDAPAQQDTSVTDAESSSDESATSTGSDQSPDSLPQTGPTESIVTGLLLGCLVAAVAAYKRSRGLSISL